MNAAIKLATWNVERRLAREASDGSRSTPESIAREILKLDADVIFLPEARGVAEIPPEIVRMFEHADYTVVECSYGDPERERREPDAARSCMFLSRVPVLSGDARQYDAFRSLPVITISLASETLTIAGVHLDDRSEGYRLKQVESIIAQYKKTTPLILMGDFNAMHRDWKTAFYRLRVLHFVAKLTPHTLLRSVVMRFLEMADGRTIERITEDLNLYDADRSHRPTTTPKMRGLEFLPSVPLAQIDHILLSEHFSVRGVSVQKDAGSDHRAIVANIALDKVK